MSARAGSAAASRIGEALEAAFGDEVRSGDECTAIIERLGPIAEEMAGLRPPLDQETVRRLLGRVAQAKLLGGTTDAAHAGSGLSIVERHLCTEHLSRFSNELAFLAQQHLGAVALIDAERQQLGTCALLPDYASGRRTIGIAASHLRQGPGAPGGLTATPAEGGLRLRGAAAWVSGYRIFDDVLVGARGPGGESLFFVLPFRESEEMRIAELADLWAMPATATVCLEIDALIGRDRIVATDRRGRFSLSHGGYLFQPVCHTLGLLYRVLGNLAALEPAMDDPMAATFAAAAARIGAARRRFYELLLAFAGGGEPALAVLDEMLWLRATLAQQSIGLAGAACALSGGKSLLTRFQLNSLLEEAVFFSTTTVNAQMKAAMASCLVTGHAAPATDRAPVREIAA